MEHCWHRRVVLGALTILIGLVSAEHGRVAAQEATQAASLEAISAGHPASIRRGTCDTLDHPPFYPLENVLVPAAGEATPAPAGRMTERHEVETSTTIVPVPIDDLLAAPSAISVHQSAEQMGTTIACGEIAGVVRPHVRGLCPGGLMIPLRELNGSGFAGMAWLQPYTDDTTTVTIFLAQGLVGPGPMAGRPVATLAP